MDPLHSLRRSETPPGCYVGEGYKIVRRMLAISQVEQLWVTPEWRDRLATEIPPGTVVTAVPKADMEAVVGYRLHQGVIAMGRIPPPAPLFSSGRIVALDGISNAENVGAILRSCAAFGVDGVLVGPGTCSPWVRRAVRVSLGAPLQIPLHFTHDLAAAIRQMGMPAYGAHIHGEKKPVGEIDWTPPFCIVLGSEADGVSPSALAACRHGVYIPMAEDWDCLNVAASAAVLLYESARRSVDHSPRIRRSSSSASAR